MPDELLSQLSSMDEETLHDSFYRSLAFGTGGLRGVLGAGTNRMNFFTVMKATRGLGAYLCSHFSDPSCAVSYDSRIHSEDFARLTASASGFIRPCIPRPCSVLRFAICPRPPAS